MFKALASAVLVASLMAQSAFAADCSRSYTVQDGDICDGISAAQNVSTYQLAVVNNGVIDNSCSNLSSNTTICLGWTGEDCSTTYTVEEDDTCEGIQTAYGVNSTILYLNNPQINEECDNIYIGEVLCVSGSVQVPPAPAGYQPPAATIPATATAASAPTTSAGVVGNAAPAPTPAPDASSGDDTVEDDDDDDLPYCDEL